MTLDNLLSVVNYYAGKDTRGGTMKIDEFNVLLPAVQDSLCLNELSKKIITDDSPMWKFIKHMGSDSTTMPLVIASTGMATVPSDYLHWIDMTFIYNSVERQVEILDGFVFNERKSNAIEEPTRRYPIATFGGTTIRFAPKNLQFVNFTYFRAPATPFYDYCQDADTLGEIYMPVGSYVKYADPLVSTDPNIDALPPNPPPAAFQQCLFDSDGNLLHANVIKTGVTALVTVTSTTVELEWESRYHPKIACMLLAMIGLNIDEVKLTEYAEAKANA